VNILVNLRKGFVEHPGVSDVMERLRRLGEVRLASHNTPDEIRADLARADAVIMWSWPVLSDELLDAAPRLRYAGHIDIGQQGAQIALRRGLPVSVSRHGFSPAVAEMALGLILGCLRRISDYHQQMRVRAENWVGDFPAEVNPLERELTGSPVGLIGFGRVGRRLAELLRPFRPTLRVYDPFAPNETLSALGGARADLGELLRASEVVVICAASNPGTRRLLGRDEIALLRPNAVLVNVARAALIDTEALVERLKRGDVFAALDVFDREPLEKDSVLRTLPNVYLTPHRAGGIMASVVRILDFLVDDLEAVLAGRERQHPLTEAMLPGLDG